MIICALCLATDINNMSACVRCRCDERSVMRSGARGGVGDGRLSCVLVVYGESYYLIVSLLFLYEC